MVYVNKKDEVRFHCFRACKEDWDIYDVVMLRKKCRFRQAQQVWAEHLGVKDFRSYDGSSPCIPEPDETPEPDDTVGFVEPKKVDQKIVAALDDAANFYHDLLMSNEDRLRYVETGGQRHQWIFPETPENRCATSRQRIGRKNDILDILTK